MDTTNLLAGLTQLRDFRSKRSSSYARGGGNHDYIIIPPGQTATVLEEGGAGCIKHFYWTYIAGRYIAMDEAVRLNIFRGVVLRAFWDGADSPSIEVPLSDFFGVSNGQLRPIRSLVFTTNPGHDDERQTSWGFNCYLPIYRGCCFFIVNLRRMQTLSGQCSNFSGYANDRQAIGAIRRYF